MVEREILRCWSNSLSCGITPRRSIVWHNVLLPETVVASGFVGDSSRMRFGTTLETNTSWMEITLSSINSLTTEIPRQLSFDFPMSQMQLIYQHRLHLMMISDKRIWDPCSIGANGCIMAAVTSAGSSFKAFDSASLSTLLTSWRAIWERTVQKSSCCCWIWNDNIHRNLAFSIWVRSKKEFPSHPALIWLCYTVNDGRGFNYIDHFDHNVDAFSRLTNSSLLRHTQRSLCHVP